MVTVLNAFILEDDDELELPDTGLLGEAVGEFSTAREVVGAMVTFGDGGGVEDNRVVSLSSVDEQEPREPPNFLFSRFKTAVKFPLRDC